MEHDLRETTSRLRRTPAVLDVLLRDLSNNWTFRNEGSETWSPRDVVGHLIHGERTDWMPRARIILEYGETKASEPFDRTAQFRQSGDLHQISRVMAYHYRDAVGPWSRFLGVLHCDGHRAPA